MSVSGGSVLRVQIERRLCVFFCNTRVYVGCNHNFVTDGALDVVWRVWFVLNSVNFSSCLVISWMIKHENPHIGPSKWLQSFVNGNEWDRRWLLGWHTWYMMNGYCSNGRTVYMCMCESGALDVAIVGHIHTYRTENIASMPQQKHVGKLWALPLEWLALVTRFICGALFRFNISMFAAARPIVCVQVLWARVGECCRRRRHGLGMGLSRLTAIFRDDDASVQVCVCSRFF